MCSFLLSIPMLNAGPPDNTRWFLVGGAGLLVIYVLMRPRKKKDPLAPGTPRVSPGQQRSVERQMESLLVEFSKMARQMSAQLDTRAAKLELLIKEADEKLSALGAAIAESSPAAKFAQAPPESEVDAPLPPEVALVPPPAPRPLSRHADIYALADQGSSSHEIARQLGRPDGEVELILALRPKT